MSLERQSPEHDATPYRKADGQWYVLRKIDRTNFIEKLATPEEVAAAREAARAALAVFDDLPPPEATKAPAPKAAKKAKSK
jgi:hypothetical protein